MSIREQILADIKEAMKAKDEFKRDTLRTLNAALKQVEVDQRIEMTDEVVLPLLQKEIKKRADSVELYIKGAREDLAKKEQGEIELIKAYLPAQLSDEELKEKIKKIIERADLIFINVPQDEVDISSILDKYSLDRDKVCFIISRYKKVENKNFEEFVAEYDIDAGKISYIPYYESLAGICRNGNLSSFLTKNIWSTRGERSFELVSQLRKLTSFIKSKVDADVEKEPVI